MPWYELFGERGGARMWLSLAPLYLSHFVALLYFIPLIKTLKKAITYSIAIPLFCCPIVYMTLNVAHIISNLEIPLYYRERNTGDIVYRLFVEEWVFLPYILSFSWIISIFLMLVCGLYLYVSRRTQQRPEEQKMPPITPFQHTVMETRLFQHKKLTFSTILIYLLFMVIYYKLYQSFWFEDTLLYRTYVFFSYICLLSFLSLFLIAPVVIGQIKRTLAFCVIAPFFWNFTIFILLIVTALLFSVDRLTIINKLFSIHFLTHLFLDRYLKTQAWLISLPLLLVCYIYARLAKSELAQQTVIRGK
jgi:hypothetical protein